MKIVREHIFEKFTEDSDPIVDMGIGILGKIDKFIKTHDIDEYVKNGQESRAEFLVQIQDTSQQQLREWIEFLCNGGYEEPEHWGEEYASDMVMLKVNFAANLKEFPDKSFSFEKDESDGNYFLYVDDWTDFIPYFAYKDRGSVSENYVKNILESDGYFYFKQNYDEFDLDDIIDAFDSEEQQKLFSYLKDEFDDLDLSEDITNLEELFKFLEEEEYQKKIEKLLRAWASYDSFICEESAWKQMTTKIKDTFGVIEEFKETQLKFKVSEKGLNDLFAAYFNSGEWGIWYDAQGADYYYKNHDIEIYIEEIENVT